MRIWLLAAVFVIGLNLGVAEAIGINISLLRIVIEASIAALLVDSLRHASHTLNAFGKGPLFTERLRYGLTLQRPKHDRIHTHWSQYSRRWDESNLWDTWF